MQKEQFLIVNDYANQPKEFLLLPEEIVVMSRTGKQILDHLKEIIIAECESRNKDGKVQDKLMLVVKLTKADSYYRTTSQNGQKMISIQLGNDIYTLYANLETENNSTELCYGYLSRKEVSSFFSKTKPDRMAMLEERCRRRAPWKQLNCGNEGAKILARTVKGFVTAYTLIVINQGAINCQQSIDDNLTPLSRKNILYIIGENSCIEREFPKTINALNFGNVAAQWLLKGFEIKDAVLLTAQDSGKIPKPKKIHYISVNQLYGNNPQRVKAGLMPSPKGKRKPEREKWTYDIYLKSSSDHYDDYYLNEIPVDALWYCAKSEIAWLAVLKIFKNDKRSMNDNKSNLSIGQMYEQEWKKMQETPLELRMDSEMKYHIRGRYKTAPDLKPENMSAEYLHGCMDFKALERFFWLENNRENLRKFFLPYVTEKNTVNKAHRNEKQ